MDHGKSTLVEALTGINPDRLKEEREREMTIDLGFAWLTLPNGEPVGVVDVPGHRDFIENMLAGVGGIDAALFVVAADEGVMPQTREHLAILDLLQIGGGVVALTKADLAEDADWLNMVSADVAAVLRGTVLQDARIVPVSARTRQGLDGLLSALTDCLAARPPRPDLQRPRLPIDRAFSIAGFGTVVTGTLVDGGLEIGAEVEILPAGRPAAEPLKARIRGLQTHKQKIGRAAPGSRVAVNLTGVEVSDLRRGDVLALPGSLRATRRLDVQFRCLPEAGSPLTHNSQVKLFVGAAEVAARVRVLGGDQIAPGETGWLQLALSAPVAVVKGDRFILRRPSPGATLGGGVIVEPRPPRKHRRRDPGVIARLETQARGTPGEILLQAVEALGLAPLKDAIASAALDAQVADQALTELAVADSLVALGNAGLNPDALVVTRAGWSRLMAQSEVALRAYHAAYPLRSGMPREELKSRLKLSARAFGAVLARAAAEGRIVESGASVQLPTHVVTFTPAQQAAVDDLLGVFRRDPFNTPSVKECAAQVGEDVLAVLLEQGALVQVSPDVLFLAESYAEMVAGVKAAIHQRGRVTVAEVRDQFKTSRKYALALLEHLDAVGVTVRKGDERVLK